LFIKNKFKFSRNIRSLKTITNDNVNIDNKDCGEIDFIIVDEQNNRLIVADSKYNKTRYEGVGYRTDYTNFTKYETQIQKKINWVQGNIGIVQTHFRKIYKNDNIYFENFNVIGMFLINTPTFYMYNSKYLVLTLNKVEDFLNNVDVNPMIKIQHKNSTYEYEYPYFTV
jgi:hypothetical protein